MFGRDISFEYVFAAEKVEWRRKSPRVGAGVDDVDDAVAGLWVGAGVDETGGRSGRWVEGGVARRVDSPVGIGMVVHMLSFIDLDLTATSTRNLSLDTRRRAMRHTLFSTIWDRQVVSSCLVENWHPFANMPFRWVVDVTPGPQAQTNDRWL